MTIKSVCLLLTVYFSLTCIACVHNSEKNITFAAENNVATVPNASGIVTSTDPAIPAKERESKIAGSEESVWKANYLTVGKSEYLDFIRVFDHRSVYIIGDKNDKNTLHKTADGGETWESLRIKVLQGEWISSAIFLNRMEGLISVIRQEGNVPDVSYSSRLLSTMDGGNSWNDTFELESAKVSDVVFDKKGTVWAAGGLSTAGKPYEDLPLLLKSSDLRNWRKIPVDSPFTGSIEHMIVSDDNTMTLAGLKGQLIEFDGDRAVKAHDDINPIMPAPIGIRDLDRTGNTLSLLGATGGRHGTSTSIFSKTRSEDKWRHYTFNDIFLTDLIAVSSDELLASGSIKNLENSKDDEVMGVILHSYDAGQTWLVSHQSVNAESFNRIVRNDDGSIWATGEKGLVLHLVKSGRETVGTENELAVRKE